MKYRFILGSILWYCWNIGITRGDIRPSSYYVILAKSNMNEQANFGRGLLTINRQNETFVFNISFSIVKLYLIMLCHFTLCFYYIWISVSLRKKLIFTKTFWFLECKYIIWTHYIRISLWKTNCLKINKIYYKWVWVPTWTKTKKSIDHHPAAIAWFSDTAH